MQRSALFPKLHFGAACVLACGLLLAAALTWWTERYEQRGAHAAFERRAQQRAAALGQGIANAVDALRVLNGLFVARPGVSAAEFSAFAAVLRARHPYIDGFAYSRLLTHAQRAAFERATGLPVRDMGEEGLLPAAARPQYRVIVYLEPPNPRLQQLDAGTRSHANAAVARATATGLPSATGLTGPDRLLGLTDPAPAFRILMPVYRAGAAPAGGAARPRDVIGYTVAVLRAGRLIERSLALFGGASFDAGLDLRVYASAQADPAMLVHRQDGRPGRPGPAFWFGGAAPAFARQFDVAGTTWLMQVSGRPAPFLHGNALLVLLAGLLASAGATAWAQAAAGRSGGIAQLVVRRTEELARLNVQLVADIAARKQAEQALLAAERRSRELVELSSDWSWEQDSHFRFTAFSVCAIEKGSAFPALLLGAARWEQAVDLDASDWPAHRALLQAHQPFRNFEYKRLAAGSVQWISCSGKPQFDAAGRFTGYLGTSRNISDRKQAEQELHRSRAALRDLAAHLERVKEDERKRIARDIHDELGQNLLALRLDVARLASASPTAARDWAGTALQQIDTAVKAVRQIINDLRPGVLDLGLHAALEWQAKQFTVRSGIACVLDLGREEFAIDEERATALFRIVQESLSNILRHAHASQVSIGLSRHDARLFMRIADDGVGLPEQAGNGAAFGLAGIEQRIHALQGEFAITSSPGRGVVLAVSVPL